MSTTVFVAVIFAAIIHSVWNGMIKKHEDKYIALVALVLGHVPLSIIVLFFTSLQSLCTLSLFPTLLYLHRIIMK